MERQRTFNRELCDILGISALIGAVTHVGINFDKYLYLKYSEIASAENLRNYAMIVSSLALVGIATRVYDSLVE